MPNPWPAAARPVNTSGKAFLTFAPPAERIGWRAVTSKRRLIKTELVLPPPGLQRALVLAGLVVGGIVALAMVALVTVFIVETIRGLR
jgi:hypothetical protein